MVHAQGLIVRGHAAVTVTEPTEASRMLQLIVSYLEELGSVFRQLQPLMLDSHFVQHFSMSEAAPGSLSCEQLKQQHSICIHIRTLAQLAFQQKLRRHVCYCTVSLRLHKSFITHSAQPKVSHLQQHKLSQQHLRVFLCLISRAAVRQLTCIRLRSTHCYEQSNLISRFTRTA